MGKRILVVEDHDLTRRHLSQFLQSEGYGIVEAKDGSEALTALKQEVDLVLTDFVLPNVYGFHLVDEIRSKRPATPIIVMSGYLEEDAGRAIFDSEAQFMAKPIKFNELSARISRALKK